MFWSHCKLDQNENVWCGNARNLVRIFVDCTHLLLIAVHQRYQHSSGRKRMIHCFNLPVYNSRVELQRSLETACHTYIHGEELFIFFTREEDAKEVVRGTRSVREYIFPSTLSLFRRSPFSFFLFFFFQLDPHSFFSATQRLLSSKTRIPLIDRLYVVEANRCEIKPVSNDLLFHSRQRWEN